MTCTRPQAESQKNPLTRGRRPHMTQSGHSCTEGRVGDANELLFWWSHIFGEHRDVPSITVTHEYPAKVSAGLFASHFARPQQTILTGSPNGIACHPRVVCHHRFLRPARLYAACKRFRDRVAPFEYGT